MLRKIVTATVFLTALIALAARPGYGGLLPVANAGFEDLLTAGDGSDGDYDYATDPPGGYYYTWPLPNWGYVGQDYSGLLNPTAALITGEAPEGQCVGFVEADTRAAPGPLTGGLMQVLGTDLAASMAYTLTVKVGNPQKIDYSDPPGNTFPGYRVQLWAGGNLLAEDANTLPVAKDTWVTSTVAYASGASVTPGEKLEIRLVNMGISPGGTRQDHYVLYDDVHLSYDPLILTWNGGGGVGSAVDGPGEWTAADKWLNGASPSSWIPGLAAVLGAGTGAAGDVTVTGSVKVKGITFNATGSGNYRLMPGAGGQIDLDGAVATVTANVNGEIKTPITNGGLEKKGGATLILSGSNNYALGTTVDAGTLQIATAKALPAGGSLTINAGGTVVLASGLNAAASKAATANAAVPEPGTIALLAAGLAGFVAAAWRRGR